MSLNSVTVNIEPENISESDSYSIEIRTIYSLVFVTLQPFLMVCV